MQYILCQSSVTLPTVTSCEAVVQLIEVKTTTCLANTIGENEAQAKQARVLVDLVVPHILHMDSALIVITVNRTCPGLLHLLSIAFH